MPRYPVLSPVLHDGTRAEIGAELEITDASAAAALQVAGALGEALPEEAPAEDAPAEDAPAEARPRARKAKS